MGIVTHGGRQARGETVRQERNRDNNETYLSTVSLKDVAKQSEGWILKATKERTKVRVIMDVEIGLVLCSF